MKRGESARPRARVVSALLAVVLGWSAGRGAAEPAGGAQPEGIKVHGHWTIDIRNSDGTLAAHHEIQNALVPVGGGEQLLAGMLARIFVYPVWQVTLMGSGSTQPCDKDFTGTTSPCMIVEPPSGRSGTEYSKNLTVRFNDKPVGTFALSGSVAAANDSIIEQVTSEWEAQDTIRGISHRGKFTEKQFGGTSPISVRQGQIIQVTVVFSFS